MTGGWTSGCCCSGLGIIGSGLASPACARTPQRRAATRIESGALGPKRNRDRRSAWCQRWDRLSLWRPACRDRTSTCDGSPYWDLGVARTPDETAAPDERRRRGTFLNTGARQSDERERLVAFAIGRSFVLGLGPTSYLGKRWFFHTRAEYRLAGGRMRKTRSRTMRFSRRRIEAYAHAQGSIRSPSQTARLRAGIAFRSAPCPASWQEGSGTLVLRRA
jgi:hypothetical protein